MLLPVFYFIKKEGGFGLLKKLLVDLYQLGITDTELEDGTVIENISLVPGKFPGGCRGILTAVVNGYKIEVEAPFSAEEVCSLPKNR